MIVHSKVNQIVPLGNSLCLAENPEAKRHIINSSTRLWDNSSGKELLSGKFYYFTPFSNGLVFNSAEGEPLQFYQDGETTSILPAGFFFNLYENRSDDTYLILSRMKEDFSLDFYYYDLDKGLTSIPFHCAQKMGDLLLSFDMRANTLKTYDLSSREVTLVYDAKEKGRRISRQSKPIMVPGKIVLTLEKNGVVILDDNDFSNEKLVETSADGNQITIVDVARNSLFVFYGQGVEQFDLETGLKTCMVQFSTDNFSRERFSGPFWQFSKYLLVADTPSGTIAVISADSMEMLHLVKLNGPGIPNAKDKVVMAGNKLFVHAMDSSVYTFDLGTEEPA
jgi:hypothetical protein